MSIIVKLVIVKFSISRVVIECFCIFIRMFYIIKLLLGRFIVSVIDSRMIVSRGMIMLFIEEGVIGDVMFVVIVRIWRVRVDIFMRVGD